MRSGSICFCVDAPGYLSSCVIVLRLSMFLLLVPYTVDPKATIFTKLGAALWAGMNDVLESIQYEWYPHTTVAPENKIKVRVNL